MNVFIQMERVFFSFPDLKGNLHVGHFTLSRFSFFLLFSNRVKHAERERPPTF